MGKRKKPGAAMLAASSKLGRLAFLSARVSARSVKSTTTPEDSAPLIDAKVVQETKSTVVPEIGVDTTATLSQCAVESSSSNAISTSEPLEEPAAQELGSPTTHVSGAPFVLIPDENIDATKEEFKEFIFARFTGDIPLKGRIIGVVNAMWARTGPRIFVHRIGEGTFLLKVTNERTKATILSRQAWMIKGCHMFIAAWSPEFTPEQPQLTSVVVSVELRGVPYLMFNQQSLSRIVTAIGRPISLAPKTERKENFEVAKVWIHVNLLESLPEKIVSGFSNGREAEISASYPWLPDKCSQCCKFGHKHQLCPSAGKLWRPIDPAAGVCRYASPLGRPKSRESQGRRRSRRGRLERARRRDLRGGRRDWVERATDNLSPHSNTAQ
ncbi:hypothetical protein F2Q69_00027225 [Brassica cretica]|uniref:DUF4283 domain-containing protein n=1 Tax=Brassica cretica TaxID=69181 RepID=A0A8S9RSW3_BRACR|nr:hypothetical protein F2Q69_00027225 [Brassica cretica]